MFEKICHYLVKYKHKLLWELKRLNLEWSDTPKIKLEKLNKMDEFHICNNEWSTLYKDRMKLYHEYNIKKLEFTASTMVLLFESKLKLFLGKL